MSYSLTGTDQYVSLQPLRKVSLQSDPRNESSDEHDETDLDHHQALCCCEYLDSNQERNHLLALCCNCVPLDEICERCVTCQPIPSSLCTSLMDTAVDRSRYPVCDGRGARKMDQQIILPALLVPLMLWSSGFSLTASILILFGFQPLLLAVAYRHRKSESINRSTSKSSKFFLSWTISTFVTLIALFELQIVAFMEIMIHENLILIALCGASLWCAVLARARSGVRRHRSNSGPSGSPPPPYRSSPDVRLKKEDEVLLAMSDPQSDPQNESNQPPSRSSDESSDRTTFYSYWIRCPIHAGNLVPYLAGLLSCVSALSYGALLTLTTICRPKYFFDDWLLVPEECVDIYDDI